MMQRLESTQYQAALAVEELGWESLSDRRWFRRLCQFYKIQNDLTPLYLKEAIHQPGTFLYGQRRENVLHEIPCRTTRFFNSFYPDTTRTWNNIGFELRNCETISKFKQKLLSLIRPPKSPSLAYMTHTESESSFNFELASVYKKGHKKS